MRRLLLPGLALLALDCHDAADREYLAYLRGDEDGSTDEERLAHLEMAIAPKPDRARYWESRAVFRIDRRELGAALVDVEHAIDLGDRPYLRFLHGLVLCQCGDCASALPEFDRAIAEQPDNSQFYRGRALALVAVGRPADGLEDAEALRRMPELVYPLLARAGSWEALGDTAAAGADRDAAARKAVERARCACCRDPFRY